MSLRSNLKEEDLHFRCPQCHKKMDVVGWGNGWSKDFGYCPSCGYDGELETMTGTDPDGTFYQHDFTDEDEDATDND